MTGLQPHRIMAVDVQVGDYIARTKYEEGRKVVSLSPGAKSVYIEFANGNRIRPRYETKLWRVAG